MPVLDVQFPSDSLTPLGSITNIIKLDQEYFKYEKHLQSAVITTVLQSGCLVKLNKAFVLPDPVFLEVIVSFGRTKNAR